jgi:hypothetical protein
LNDAIGFRNYATNQSLFSLADITEITRLVKVGTLVGWPWP